MGKNTFRHSEKAFEQVENLVEALEAVDSKSDFYQTVTDYALIQATEGEYETDIDDFDQKVTELGLNQLSTGSGFEHFDFAAAVYHVSRDEDIPAEERIEYLQDISEEQIKTYFPDSRLADSIASF